jgi:phosphoribosyl-AMP cyclohydrolase
MIIRSAMLGGEPVSSELQWDFFDHLPVVLQDVSTRDVLMVQYMTHESLERTLEERSTWLWSRSRKQHWLAGREGGGYDVVDVKANCMGDSLFALVDAADRGVCHLGYRSCFSQPVGR